MTAKTASTKTTKTAAAVIETPVKRGPGRPRKYFTPEDIAQAKRDAVARSVAKKKQAQADAINAVLAELDAINANRLNKTDQARIAESRQSLTALIPA